MPAARDDTEGVKHHGACGRGQGPGAELVAWQGRGTAWPATSPDHVGGPWKAERQRGPEGGGRRSGARSGVCDVSSSGEGGRGGRDEPEGGEFASMSCP